MNIKFVKPNIENGKDIYTLVKNTQVLDLNSEYLYLLQSSHFSDYCCVALVEDKVLGFVSGYIDPKDSSVYFVWQVGVDESMRGQGLALKMIMDILQRDELSNINYVHTTISPSNKSSQRLFEKLADQLSVNIKDEIFFKVDDFNNAHEDEVLYKIGPIKK
ncbi:MAG: diaminobutyrate acetyltransferase [Arcobacteraceae bacterium]